MIILLLIIICLLVFGGGTSPKNIADGLEEFESRKKIQEIESQVAWFKYRQEHPLDIKKELAKKCTQQ